MEGFKVKCQGDMEVRAEELEKELLLRFEESQTSVSYLKPKEFQGGESDQLHQSLKWVK